MSVCEASSEPSSSAAAVDQPSPKPAIVPNSIGKLNVSRPNVIAERRWRRSSARSSSTPAMNIR
jgi:hypothetical protein